MKKTFLLIIVIIAILAIPFALGATIHGKLFDYSFALAKNSVVGINSVPEQKIVAVDGSYSFSVAPGDYTITAYLKDELGRITYFVEDNISIVNEGTYVRDLILFPDEALDELDLNGTIDPGVDVSWDNETSPLLIIVIGFVILIFIVFIITFVIKKPEKEKETKEKEPVAAAEKETIGPEEEDELAELQQFIRKNKRVTQKEIRKQFPVSEAKISLMITDLESQGKIRKIKKGRGNIIVWQ